jgi:hypothetical protein
LRERRFHLWIELPIHVRYPLKTPRSSERQPPNIRVQEPPNVT